MTGGRTLGLLGGTFDPIHYGHLDAAEASHAALGLDEILLVPSHDPPHRPIDPRATVFHRFALVALAIEERPYCRVSDLELRRQGPSFSIDTLHTLHADGWTPSQLFFIIGADAFAEIATWREYPRVLDAANFAVIARPGTPAREAIARNPELAGRLKSAPTGIFIIDARTRDVSSTMIRERLAAGQSIDELVPGAVARHIHAHHLYGAVGRLHGENEHAGH